MADGSGHCQGMTEGNALYLHTVIIIACVFCPRRGNRQRLAAEHGQCFSALDVPK